MSKKISKKAKKSGEPFLQRLAKGLYIALFALSLVVVVGFVALKIWAPEPTVDDQVTIDPDYEGPQLPASADDPNSSSGSSTSLTFKRREGVFTCLLLGVADQGGTDTIMLGVFDTRAGQASLISIPRDTVVYYNGKYQKINATYAGGEEAVAGAVRDLLGIPVDYWVSVNLKAFEEIVNQIGGVYFDVPTRMDYDDPYQNLHIHIAPGYQLLDGKKAVGVMRCRSCYANADIGRAATQRAFLVALAKQVIVPSNVTKVTSLINTFSQYVKSNMPLNDMVWFGTQAIGMDLDTALTTGSLEGQWISPYWYLDGASVLELVNGLGIYQEQIPAQAMHIIDP